MAGSVISFFICSVVKYHWEALKQFSDAYKDPAYRLPTVYAPSFNHPSFKNRLAKRLFKEHVDTHQLSLLTLKEYICNAFTIVHRKCDSVLSTVWAGNLSDKQIAAHFQTSIRHAFTAFTDPVRLRKLDDCQYSGIEPRKRPRKNT